MKHLSIGWIITIFAILHSATAIICRAIDIDDSIILTVLTMALTAIICLKKQLNIEFISVNIILVNIVGYVLGITFASIIGEALRYSPAIYALSTFITTQLIGWGLLWFISIFPDSTKSEKTDYTKDSYINWLLIAIGSILFVRMILGIILNLFEEGTILNALSDFLSGTIILFILVAATILFIQYLHRKEPKFNTTDIFIAVFVFFIVTSAISAMMVGYGLPHPSRTVLFTFKRFVELFIVAMICEAAIYSIIFLVDYALASRKNVENERKKANIAKSQYINLKQQVNPHFLFNSLNMLDCLMAENETQMAREYLMKLSGIYRYMLNKENESIVSLEEEIEYSEMYIQLLKLRFQDGLKIHKNISKESLKKFVITYSVQMLLENATKHNSISPEKPLHIYIDVDEYTVTVTNNLLPKINPAPSTGIGLQYIRKNYIDMTGKDIVINKTEDNYSVSLPLL